ncbi:MAG: hypothetical protein QOE71_1913 [Pseudonocardiales bacterium]|nr:hypothetical protein [Pseudonocardiales bacterium]MDQ1750857.1 hypothetical protein [Pseudonocardiales bacterium]
MELHGASVGMDQIAAVAGTSKAVFYRHFSDKADLYRAVGQQLAGVFSDQLSRRMSSQADPRAMVAAGIDSYLALLEKRPELYRFVVRNPVLEQAGSYRRIDYTGIIASRLDDIIRLASPAQDPVDPARRPWGTAIVGFIKSAGDWWLDHPHDLTRAELTASLTDLLWNGAAGTLAVSGRPANERREGA